MLLSRIVSDPFDALGYMEQFVNIGSPSGYSQRNAPSHRYAPGTAGDPFSLNCLVASREQRAEDFGYVPALPNDVDLAERSDWAYIHPDVVDHPSLATSEIRLCSSPRVLPTSSGRTVQIVSELPPWHIKLSYPGLLGRIDRSLPRIKAIAGPEVSEEITKAIDGEGVSKDVHLLRELGARTITVDDGATWGMVVRSPEPYGARADQVRALVPFFALFSPDSRAPQDSMLLWQLARAHRPSDYAEFVYKSIVRPTLSTYFALVGTLGLQPELNAQNLLLGIDHSATPVAVVMRDMMGVEKDLTIRASLGLDVNFQSFPYKCIGTELDDRVYPIRHSFGFDFKLGSYVLQPLIDATAELGGSRCASELVHNIRDEVSQFTAGLPANYLPKGVWYSHPKQLLTQARPYISNSGPAFRE